MKKLLVTSLIMSLMLTCGAMPVSAKESVESAASAQAVTEEVQEENAASEEQGQEEHAFVTQDAEKAVKIDAEHFPDQLFRKYVTEQFDADKDGELSAEEIKKATKVDVKGTDGLNSLKGIEFLTELTYLDCSADFVIPDNDEDSMQTYGGNVQELDVSNNLKLEILRCSLNSGIENLNISGNTKLKELECANISGIAELDVSECPDLEVLNAESTGISEINVTKNAKLKKLNVSSTYISKVDVTKNPELEVLNVAACMNEDWEYDIADVDVTKNPKLKELDIAMSSVSELNVSRNPELEILYLYRTPMSNLDISNNDKLVRLDINNTDISSVDVADKPELFALNVEMTKVSEVDVTHNPKLYEVYMTGDKAIKEIDLTHNPELAHLRVAGTSISKLDLSKNPKLAALFNNRSEEYDMATDEVFEIAPAPIAEYDFSKNPKLYEVYLDGTDVTALDVTNAPGLRHLSLNDTKIEKLDVTRNKNLVSLKVNNTKLTSLDLSQNKNLHTLAFANTKIEELKNLDFTGYKYMLSLDCTNAGVESLKFDKAPGVHEVKCSNNAIAEIDLEGRKNEKWAFNTLEAEEQNATIEVPKEQLESGKVFLKDMFSDPSRVTVLEGEGYTCDPQEQAITFEQAEQLKFNYKWDTKFGTDDDLMSVSAVLAEKKPEPVKEETAAKIRSLKISADSRKIAAGRSVRLSVAVLPETAVKFVAWSSSDEKVARVDQNGKVTMQKKSGGKKVTITATANDGSGVKATYQLTSMKGVVKKVAITGKKTVKAGKALKLKAMVTATKGANKAVKWTCSNAKYAKVSASGKVTAYKAGKGKKVKITAMATDGSGKKKTIVVKIK